MSVRKLAHTLKYAAKEQQKSLQINILRGKYCLIVWQMLPIVVAKIARLWGV